MTQLVRIVQASTILSQSDDVLGTYHYSTAGRLRPHWGDFDYVRLDASVDEQTLAVFGGSFGERRSLLRQQLADREYPLQYDGPRVKITKLRLGDHSFAHRILDFEVIT